MKRSLPWLVLLFCFAAFAFGLFELFKLRYEVGDIYPEYSSLRTDPLGAMIFYESLQQLPHLSVRRDFSAADELPEDRNTGYLHLAATRRDWEHVSAELLTEIEKFMHNGGRLVVTFLPQTAPPFRFGSPVLVPPKTNPKATKKAARSGESDPLKERWGVEFGFEPLATGEGPAYRPVPVVNRSQLPLPETLAWHSGMVFTNLASSWHIIYARGTNAVLIERRFGAGSAVLATDSYFISNEAMAKSRHADLLAWMVGPSEQVVFDEAHLGIVDAPGISTLMRKYRLEGLVIGLAALAGLFIWKNSTSLAPRFIEERGSSEVIGKDASAGLVNLLRRNIPSKELLRVCFEQWTRSLLQSGYHSITRVDQAQAVLEAENARAKVDRDPVRAYKEICRVLKGNPKRATE